MADALTRHLRNWVGAWPPPRGGVHVVGDPRREQPSWDGKVRLLHGVSDGIGTVIAVPPVHLQEVRRVVGADLDDPTLGTRLGGVLGLDNVVFGTGAFRWTHLPTPLPDHGTWVGADDGRLPEWLAPFNGRRLVAWDRRGAYIAGIGIKVHDRWGQEIAVVTTPATRGKGVARRLVATAARRILADGAIPTYLHQPSNMASARVADAAGFPDRGWLVHGLWGR